jgi:hypothetical protein
MVRGLFSIFSIEKGFILFSGRGVLDNGISGVRHPLVISVEDFLERLLIDFFEDFL